MTSKTLAIAAAACWLALGTSAFADEVTKTTTTTTKTSDPVVVAPAPAAGVVVDDDAGCKTKQVTKTDGATGDTVKKTATNCD